MKNTFQNKTNDKHNKTHSDSISEAKKFIGGRWTKTDFFLILIGIFITQLLGNDYISTITLIGGYFFFHHFRFQKTKIKKWIFFPIASLLFLYAGFRIYSKLLPTNEFKQLKDEHKTDLCIFTISPPRVGGPFLVRIDYSNGGESRAQLIYHQQAIYLGKGGIDDEKIESFLKVYETDFFVYPKVHYPWDISIENRNFSKRDSFNISQGIYDFYIAGIVVYKDDSGKVGRLRLNMKFNPRTGVFTNYDHL